MSTRKMKRFSTIAAIAMIASCVAMPMTTAFAASVETGGNTITVVEKGDYTHEEVAAYQIFTGKYENNQLTVNGWGDGVNVEAFIAALQADATFGEGEANKFADVAYDEDNPGKSAQDVAKAIAAFSSDTSELEEEVFAKIAVANKSANTSGNVDGQVISKLPDGYYVIVDESAASHPGSEGVAPGTAWSLGMLKVAGNTGAELEVTTKLDYPKMEKKIYENVKFAEDNANYEAADPNGENKWNDVADYSIGDAVPFKLYAQMPSNIEDYQHYYIKFSDKLGEEFTLPSNATFKICVDGEEVDANVFNIHKNTSPITTDGDAYKGGTLIEITIEDVYALGYAIDETSVITVEYSAILNTNADIGLDGQLNTAKLEYSNNPNVLYAPKTNGPTDEEKDGDKPNNEYTEEDTTPENPDVPDDDSTEDVDESQDNTGDTPWDTVIAYTYKLDVTKVDGVSGEELEGAEFVLKNEDGEFAMVDANNKFRGWSAAKIGTLTDTEIDDETVKVTTKLVSDADGLFTVSGLDDGTYYLQETKQPNGYNLLEGDITLVISANTQHTQAWSGVAADGLTQWVDTVEDTNTYDVVKLVVNDDEDKAAYSTDNTYAVATKVQNFMGLQLPSTGGIGTTIFYVVGGTMAAGAGVYLISKKRMKKDEE